MVKNSDMRQFASHEILQLLLSFPSNGETVKTGMKMLHNFLKTREVVFTFIPGIQKPLIDDDVFEN